MTPLACAESRISPREVTLRADDESTERWTPCRHAVPASSWTSDLKRGIRTGRLGNHMNDKSSFTESHQVNPEYRWRWSAFVVGFLALLWPAVLAAQGLNPCDLTGDGTVNAADVNLAVSMALGQSACQGNVSGTGACTVVSVQRVVNAALSGTCVAGNVHTVSISWTASSSSNVVGYNVYRAATPGGPFVKMTTSPLTGTSFTDNRVQGGQTYFYAATSVDDLGNESVFSPTTSVTVPFP